MKAAFGRLKSWVLPHPWLVLACIVYLAMKLPDLALLPRWDSAIYWDWVLRSIHDWPSKWHEIDLCDHPSWPYGTYLAIGQVLAHGSVLMTNLQNALLGIATLASLYFWLGRALPGSMDHGPRGGFDRSLVASLVLFSPVVFAGSMGVHLDWPMFVFAAWTLLGLAMGSRRLFFVSGFLLCFSKEPGWMLYVALSVFLLVALLPWPWQDRVPGAWTRLLPGGRTRFRRWLWLALPVIGLALVWVLYVGLLMKGGFWNRDAVFGGSGMNSFQSPFGNRDYALLKTRLIFLFQGNWLFLAVGFLSCWVLLIQRIRRRGATDPTGGWWIGLCVLLLGILYLFNVTFVTAAHSRYHLVTQLLLLLACLGLLLLAWKPSWARTAFLCLLLVLTVSQIHRTIDPVTRSLFPTFQFGNRVMVGYDLASDELVYNGEFAVIEDLWNAMNRQMVLTPWDHVVLPEIGVDWNRTWRVGFDTMANQRYVRVRNKDLRRTFHSADAFLPRVANQSSIRDLPGSNRVLIPLCPWVYRFQDPVEIQRETERYRILANASGRPFRQEEVRVGDYSMKVLTLGLRDARPSP